jgi:hypothetical protein
VEKVILMKIITNFLSVDTEFQPYWLKYISVYTRPK